MGADNCQQPCALKGNGKGESQCQRSFRCQTLAARPACPGSALCERLPPWGGTKCVCMSGNAASSGTPRARTGSGPPVLVRRRSTHCAHPTRSALLQWAVLRPWRRHTKTRPASSMNSRLEATFGTPPTARRSAPSKGLPSARKHQRPVCWEDVRTTPPAAITRIQDNTRTRPRFTPSIQYPAPSARPNWEEDYRLAPETW